MPPDEKNCRCAEHSLFQDKARQVSEIWDKLESKVKMSTFTWVVSGLVLIMLAVGGGIILEVKELAKEVSELKGMVIGKESMGTEMIRAIGNLAESLKND